METASTPPGWYDNEGGLRFWSGSQWTEQRAPTPPPAPKSIGIVEVIAGVALGMVLGWAIIYLGAQLAPEAFYWPVKFVVEEDVFNNLTTP
jgi:proline-rich tail region repeat protein